MQFDPAPLRAAGPGRSRAELLAQSLLRGPSAGRSRETDLRTLTREDRLREDENQRRRAALDASTPLAGSADVIRSEERRMEIGSRAFERGQVRQRAGEQAAASHNAFREALHEARRPHHAGEGRADASLPPRGSDRCSIACSSLEPGAKASQTASGGQESAQPATGSQLLAGGPVGRPGAPHGPPARGAAAPTQAAGATVPQRIPGAGGEGRLQAAAANVGSLAFAPAVGQSSGLTTTAIDSESARVALPAAVRSESGGPRSETTVTAARSSARPDASQPSHAPRPAVAESAEREARIERIVRVIYSEIGRERSRTTLRLDPPEIGMIRMHMDLQKDRLLLRIDTQTEVAHRLLSEDIDALRQGLAQWGIHLEKVEMRPLPQRFDPPAEGGTHSPPQEGSSRQDTDGSATGRPEREAAGSGRFLPARAGERPGGEETQSAGEPRLNVWA